MDILARRAQRLRQRNVRPHRDRITLRGPDRDKNQIPTRWIMSFLTDEIINQSGKRVGHSSHSWVQAAQEPALSHKCNAACGLCQGADVSRYPPDNPVRRWPPVLDVDIDSPTRRRTDAPRGASDACQKGREMYH